VCSCLGNQGDTRFRAARYVRGTLLSCLVACGRFGFDPIGHVSTDSSGSDDLSDGKIPAGTNIAFVTSVATVAGDLGGIAAGDTLCNSLATSAGLPGTYVAWLASDTVDAQTRVGTARGWVRTDGLPFLDQVSDLDNFKTFYPLDLDENGHTVPSGTNIVTGADQTGHTLGVNANCNGYTSTAAAASFGEIPGSVDAWSQAIISAPCTLSTPIYCFGIGNATPITLPSITTRRAFVMNATTTAATLGGIAGADTMCQGAATTAGLSGTFHALLALTTGSAISRFNLTGSNWVRMDGLPIAASPQQFAAASWSVAFNISAEGYYEESFLSAWTGAATLGAVGTNATTCNNWTGGNKGYQGTYTALDSTAVFDGTAVACTLPNRLYCLEP
jgi:hypothetical protein